MSEALDFAETCLPYQKRLLDFASRLAKSQHGGKDLVQETYARAIAAWHRFEPDPSLELERSVSAWLHQICLNLFINDYRRARHRNRQIACRRHDVVAGTYGAAAPNQGALTGPTPHDSPDPRASVGAALGDELEAAMARLPPAWRMIVERVHLNGELCRVVAEDMGLPLNTVLTRLHRARVRLSAELAGYAEREYGIAADRTGAEDQADHATPVAMGG